MTHAYEAPLHLSLYGTREPSLRGLWIYSFLFLYKYDTHTIYFMSVPRSDGPHVWPYHRLDSTLSWTLSVIHCYQLALLVTGSLTSTPITHLLAPVAHGMHLFSSPACIISPRYGDTFICMGIHLYTFFFLFIYCHVYMLTPRYIFMFIASGINSALAEPRDSLLLLCSFPLQILTTMITLHLYKPEGRAHWKNMYFLSHRIP